MYIGHFRRFICSFFSFYIFLSYCNQINLSLLTLKKVVMLNTSKKPVGHSQTTQVFVKN